MRLPRRWTVPDIGPPETSRFRHEPAIWHLVGTLFWGKNLLSPKVIRWWVHRYVAAVNRAADAERERDQPIGV